METFSTPWTHLPTMTSYCESVASPKPAARRARRAWLYHVWSRKGSKYPRASSESALPSSASLKLLDITKSHFINPDSVIWIFYLMDLLHLLSCSFLAGSCPCVSCPYGLCDRHRRTTVVLTRFALRLHIRGTLCVRSIYQMQSFMHEHTKQRHFKHFRKVLKAGESSPWSFSNSKWIFYWFILKQTKFAITLSRYCYSITCTVKPCKLYSLLLLFVRFHFWLLLLPV